MDYVRSNITPISNRPKEDCHNPTLTRKQKIVQITRDTAPQTLAIAWAMEETF